ncbi:uncharacterized protein LOC131205207 [Anopheles bellator]|uniref:uncharacterized protein LOC131205207 n=1 Tax=Anopheles bellator TaxID=139047 RepID=UPI002648A236|nr:uncharacterized protein LOC131205207 [Anopheles bellator]
MNLNDMPDEVLCQIFDKLDVYELKLASLVCRRWAELTFAGQRMDRVWFMLPDADWEPLLNIKRPYRNINHDGRLLTEVPFERLSRLLQILKLPVRMLQIDYGLTFEELRLILLEVPELQHLSIKSYIDSNGKTNGPFPVLTKLKCLELYRLENNEFDFFAMNILNLHSLYMSCDTDSELEAWKHLSGQLQLVNINQSKATHFSHFLELTFPHLEDFTIEKLICETTEEENIVSSRGNDFFRRHSLLRRLSVSVTFLVEWIRSITIHCPNLTYLDLLLKDPEEGILESLVHCPLLKHLKLDGKLDTKLFRGTIKSLESVKLRMHPSRVFLENLFETAPQLYYLEINPICYEYLQVLDCKFICEKFSCLRRLELDLTYGTPADNSGLVRIDRLVHLEKLKLWALNNIHCIHQNNVRCLTISHFVSL